MRHSGIGSIAQRALKLVVISSLVVLPMLASARPSVAQPEATTAGAARPNILEIMLDDARSDLWTVMPKTAAVLLNDGRNFVNNVTPDPNCCPARAATMSGRYPHNNGVRTEADALLLDQSHTIQSYLTNAGYMTALSGKFLVSWPAKTPPPNFDRYTYIKYGYYHYSALVGTKQNGGSSVYKGADAGSYSTNFLTSQMQKYIDGFVTKSPTKPWYGLLAYQAPHLDMPTYRDRATPEAKYANAPVPPCVDPGEADKTDKPTWIRNWNYTTTQVDVICTSQERTLLTVDDNVSSLLQHLKDTGQYNNTLIIFTSDNGFMWHENNLAMKFTPYAPAVHVPLVLVWPGHVTPGPDTRNSSLVDILPTILGAARITADPTVPVDGYSLLGTHLRKYQYSEYWYDTEARTSLPSWAEIRTVVTSPPYNGHTLVLHRWYGMDPLLAGPVTAEELYDLTIDPKQLDNVLGDNDPANDPPPAVLTQLRNLLEAAHSCAGSNCP